MKLIILIYILFDFPSKTKMQNNKVLLNPHYALENLLRSNALSLPKCSNA